MTLDALRQRIEQEVLQPCTELLLRGVALQRAAELFPGWTVGWWAFEGGRCAVEVTRRWKVEGERLARWSRRTFAGETWGEVLGKLEAKGV